MTVSREKYQDTIISCSKSAYELMKGIFDQREPIDKNRENVWIINLNNANRVLDIELISMGTTNETIVTPREVFCTAVRMRASKIIIIHNHPSNTWIPSFADMNLTDNLIQVGKLISIPVIDHIILLDKDYFSFADTCLIDILTKDHFYNSAAFKRIEEKEKLYKKMFKCFSRKNLLFSSDKIYLN